MLSVFFTYGNAQQEGLTYKFSTPREEGKTGPDGVFATPAQVELAKMGHACHATSTFEYASSNILRDVPLLRA